MVKCCVHNSLYNRNLLCNLGGDKMNFGPCKDCGFNRGLYDIEGDEICTDCWDKRIEEKKDAK